MNLANSNIHDCDCCTGMLLSIAKINLLHIRQHILTYKKIRIKEHGRKQDSDENTRFSFSEFFLLFYRAPARLLHEQPKKSRENISGHFQ